MAILTRSETEFAQTIDALVFVNPFSRQRIELERRALGDQFRDEADAWRAGPGHRNRNIGPVLRRTREIVERMQPQLGVASREETMLFGSLVRYMMYYEYEDELFRLSLASRKGNLRKTKVSSFARFKKQFDSLACEAREFRPLLDEPEHLFAVAFQLRRAFERIFLGMVGASRPATRLRAEVWESVFTHDQRRYQRTLFAHMHEINTLILGPSGTGKELVARAIGESRYIPFDGESQRFTEETHDTFLPLNLSALAPTLVESELFGHCRGSFTGATHDREGFLESCPRHGTVFLDEIGELSEELQVKLLRTLQERELTRLGEREVRRFVGKLVFATNRDLAQGVSEGTFREDFLYRLRGDTITTPSLQEQLADCPDDLPRLVGVLCERLVPDHEVKVLQEEVVTHIESNLATYSWPGNVRELEQCIRSLLVHGRYDPETTTAPGRATAIGRKMIDGHYSFDDLSDLYVTLAHQRFGSFSETARRLELDRRTVKTRVRPELLDG